jgi:NADH:ubiquinone oxidoreductase subunit C
MLLKRELISKLILQIFQPFLSKGIVRLQMKNDTIELTVDSKNLHLILSILRLHSLLKFKYLLDIAVVDNLLIKNTDNAYRFCIYYFLTSTLYNCRLTICVPISLNESVPSITPIFRSANWMEREIWDLFGIFFISHPDLRRILTDYGFKGHPLRKDFPVAGFQEVSYNTISKLIEYAPIELTQELRLHTFSNPWIDGFTSKNIEIDVNVDINTTSILHAK